MYKKHSSLIFVTLLLFSGISLAQPPGPMGGPPCWPPPCTIPIDGGISILIAAGSLLGGKKLYDLRKGNKAE